MIRTSLNMPTPCTQNRDDPCARKPLTLQSHIMHTDTSMHKTAYSYREKYKENSTHMPYF